MLNKLEMKKLAKYYNIISCLLKNYKIDSLFKVQFLSFVIYNNEGIVSPSSAINNLVQSFFKCFHYQLISNYKDFVYINEVLNILENNNFISINDDCIVVNKETNYENDGSILFSKNMDRTINEFRIMGLKSFVEEVISNV